MDSSYPGIRHAAPWRSVGLPVLVAILAVLMGFFVVTRVLDTMQGGGDRPTSGEHHLPSQFYVPSTTVPTTADHGAVGPVGAVIAVQSVVTGISGEQTNPWVAISSLDGAMRAISQPDLPPASRGTAVRIAADGSMLAWPSDASVVLYDPEQDSTRTVPTQGPPTLGAFSPDGSHLLINDGALGALEVASGEVVGLAEDVPSAATAGGAWTLDGQSVSWVGYGKLSTAGLDGSRTEQATSLPPTTMLAWSPSGEQLLTLDRDGGTLRRWSRSGDGLRVDGRVRQAEGIYLERLVGYVDGDRAAVIGLARGTSTELMSLDLATGQVETISNLPPPGAEGNWLDTSTLSLANDALRNDTEDFPAALDVWSDRAVLSALIIAVGCVLGFYLTRRRRRR